MHLSIEQVSCAACKHSGLITQHPKLCVYVLRYPQGRQEGKSGGTWMHLNIPEVTATEAAEAPELYRHDLPHPSCVFRLRFCTRACVPVCCPQARGLCKRAFLRRLASSDCRKRAGRLSQPRLERCTVSKLWEYRSICSFSMQLVYSFPLALMF